MADKTSEQLLADIKQSLASDPPDMERYGASMAVLSDAIKADIIDGKTNISDGVAKGVSALMAGAATDKVSTNDALKVWQSSENFGFAATEIAKMSQDDLITLTNSFLPKDLHKNTPDIVNRFQQAAQTEVARNKAEMMALNRDDVAAGLKDAKTAKERYEVIGFYSKDGMIDAENLQQVLAGAGLGTSEMIDVFKLAKKAEDMVAQDAFKSVISDRIIKPLKGGQITQSVGYDVLLQTPAKYLEFRGGKFSDHAHLLPDLKDVRQWLERADLAENAGALTKEAATTLGNFTQKVQERAGIYADRRLGPETKSEAPEMLEALLGNSVYQPKNIRELSELMQKGGIVDVSHHDKAAQQFVALAGRLNNNEVRTAIESGDFKAVVGAVQTAVKPNGGVDRKAGYETYMGLLTEVNEPEKSSLELNMNIRAKEQGLLDL